jgi:hypothetical protein
MQCRLDQGTMTHMAPEIMLDGRVSKAADVYGEWRVNELRVVCLHSPPV